MDFSIDQKEFNRALAVTTGIVERNNGRPILENVLLQVGDNLNISASDTETLVEHQCPARIAARGSTTVAAKTLYALVRKLPPGDVRVSSLGDDSLEVSSGHTTTTLPTLPAADFPELTRSKNEVGCSLDIASDALQRIVAQTVFATSTETTRLNLNGALLRSTGKTLRLVATDGHRLAISECQLDKAAKLKADVILSRKPLIEVRKLAKGPVRVVKLIVRSDVAKVVDGPAQITMRLPQTTFPNYEPVVPPASPTPAVVACAALLDTLGRLPSVPSGHARQAKLTLTTNALAVSSNDPDASQVSGKIEVDYTGQPVSQTLNARYLVDALKTLPKDANVSLSLHHDGGPALIQIDDPDLFAYVVMPIRE